LLLQIDDSAMLLQIDDSAMLLPWNYAWQTKELQMFSNILRRERGFQMKLVKQGIWLTLSFTHNSVCWKPLSNGKKRVW
jgi:hypothetical protein